jgi:uncharacterized protein
MVVGILQVELMIHDAMTLKDKRRVIKSIKDRIAHDFNVSIAEVDALDRHRQAILGISLVGNDGKFVRTCLDEVIKRLRFSRGASLVDYQIDLV